MRKIVAVMMILILLAAAFLVAMPTSAAPAASEPRVTKRPVEDFLEPQMWPAAPSILFLTDPDNGRWAFVDFFGRYNTMYGNPFGTEIWGSVTERVLNNGLTEVHVVLHAKNTICWVWAAPGGPLLFGNYPVNVLLYGVEPALTECLFELKYITINAPGEPMLDFFKLALGQIPGSYLLQNTISARATGPLHEAYGVPYGTPGAMKITMKAVLNTNFNGAVADGFPVENIELKEMPN